MVAVVVVVVVSTFLLQFCCLSIRVITADGAIRETRTLIMSKKSSAKAK